MERCESIGAAVAIGVLDDADPIGGRSLIAGRPEMRMALHDKHSARRIEVHGDWMHDVGRGGEQRDGQSRIERARRVAFRHGDRRVAPERQRAPYGPQRRLCHESCHRFRHRRSHRPSHRHYQRERYRHRRVSFAWNERSTALPWRPPSMASRLPETESVRSPECFAYRPSWRDSTLIGSAASVTISRRREPAPGGTLEAVAARQPMSPSTCLSARQTIRQLRGSRRCHRVLPLANR